MAVELKTRPQDVVGYIELTPGERLRGLRELMGMTQKNLEGASGVKQSDISAIERDKKNMGLIVAKRLAGGLGVPVARLVDEASASDRITAMMDKLSAKSEEHLMSLMETAARLENYEAGTLIKVKAAKEGVDFVVVKKRPAAKKKVAAKRKVAVKKVAAGKKASPRKLRTA